MLLEHPLLSFREISYKEIKSQNIPLPREDREATYLQEVLINKKRIGIIQSSKKSYYYHEWVICIQRYKNNFYFHTLAEVYQYLEKNIEFILERHEDYL